MEENEIKIGTQTWTSKNLDVETYRNGDEIPQVKDKKEWTNLTTGAWCYYENKGENGTTYGKLYNWYAVNDPRGLAPKGYHIPTDAEWTILNEGLGVADVPFIKADEAGNNTSGFAGLPGGSRDCYGNFYSVGAFGYWWSSSEDGTYNAWNSDSDLSSGAGFAPSYFDNEQNGFSVRCLRD